MHDGFGVYLYLYFNSHLQDCLEYLSYQLKSWIQILSIEHNPGTAGIAAICYNLNTPQLPPSDYRWSTTRAASLKSALRKTATTHMLRWDGGTAEGRCLFLWTDAENHGEVTRPGEDTRLLISCPCSLPSPSLNSDQQLDGTPASSHECWSLFLLLFHQPVT